MPNARWLLACAVIAFGVFAVVVAAFGGRNPTGTARESSKADGSSYGPTTPSSVATAMASPPSTHSTPTATSPPSASPPSSSVGPRPSVPPPRATGDPRLAYAEFLLRVNDDRSTVDGLNRAVAQAAEAGDPATVRTAAVAILDFVDAERDWLGAHPPATCYAAAHDAANAMLEAYGTAADRFVDWTAAGGGLDGLAALGRAADAAQTAGDALTAFGVVLEATRCAA